MLLRKWVGLWILLSSAWPGGAHAQPEVRVPDQRTEGIPLGVHPELAPRFFKGIWDGVIADLGGAEAMRPGATNVMVSGSSVRGWSFKRRDVFRVGESDIDFAIRSDELVEVGLAKLRQSPEILDSILQEKEFAAFRTEPEPRQALLTHLAREGFIPHTHTQQVFAGVGRFMENAHDPAQLEGKAVTWTAGRETATVNVSVMVHSKASFDRSYTSQLDQWRRAKGRELPGTPRGEQCIDVPPPETLGTQKLRSIGHETFVPPERRTVRIQIAEGGGGAPAGNSNPRPEGLLGMGEPDNPAPARKPAGGPAGGPALTEAMVDGETIQKVFLEEAIVLAKDPKYAEQAEALITEGERLSVAAREAGGRLPERIVLAGLKASEIPALRFESLGRIAERLAKERRAEPRPVEVSPGERFRPKGLRP